MNISEESLTFRESQDLPKTLIGRNQKVSNLGATLITWVARRRRIAGTQIPSTFLVKVFT